MMMMRKGQGSEPKTARWNSFKEKLQPEVGRVDIFEVERLVTSNYRVKNTSYARSTEEGRSNQ